MKTKKLVYEDLYLNISAELVEKGRDMVLEIRTKPELQDDLNLERLLQDKNYVKHDIVVSASKPLDLEESELRIKPFYVNRDGDKLKSSCQEYPVGFKLKREGKSDLPGVIEVEVYVGGPFRVAYLVLEPIISNKD